MQTPETHRNIGGKEQHLSDRISCRSRDGERVFHPRTDLRCAELDGGVRLACEKCGISQADLACDALKLYAGADIPDDGALKLAPDGEWAILEHGKPALAEAHDAIILWIAAERRRHLAETLGARIARRFIMRARDNEECDFPLTRAFVKRKVRGSVLRAILLYVRILEEVTALLAEQLHAGCQGVLDADGDKVLQGLGLRCALDGALPLLFEAVLGKLAEDAEQEHDNEHEHHSKNHEERDLSPFHFLPLPIRRGAGVR